MRFWFLIAAMMGPRFFARFLLFFVLGMGLIVVLLPSCLMRRTAEVTRQPAALIWAIRAMPAL